MSSEHNKTSKEYLAFMIDGIHLAADIGMISEIVKTGNVELLAESGTLVSGVMQVRKDNVLIVELSTFINHKAQDGKLCIVVDYDGKRYGFPVDELIAKVKLDPGELVGDTFPTTPKYIVGTFRIRNHVFSLLDFRAIAEGLGSENEVKFNRCA